VESRGKKQARIFHATTHSLQKRFRVAYGKHGLYEVCQFLFQLPFISRRLLWKEIVIPLRIFWTRQAAVGDPFVSKSMTDESSITNWMGQLKGGDNAAAEPIWHHFFGRLVEFARNHMRGVSTVASDEEDVALSVLKSVCIGLRAGRFSDLQGSESLWRMLLVICGRKITNHYKFQTRSKRDATKQSSLQSDDEMVSALISQEPSPEMAAEFSENLSHMIDSLERPELKEVAILKMQGYTNEEIGMKQNCSLSTIERKLRTIRTLWKNSYGLA
jgi:RNA polymerase sigma factor (sigma-70 family)